MRKISPRQRTRWSGAISGGGGRCWVGTSYAEPTVDDAAHRQRPGDLRVPVMTCNFSWWQVLGSNQRRLSRRFYRPPRLRAIYRPYLRRPLQGRLGTTIDPTYIPYTQQRCWARLGAGMVLQTSAGQRSPDPGADEVGQVLGRLLARFGVAGELRESVC